MFPAGLAEGLSNRGGWLQRALSTRGQICLRMGIQPKFPGLL